MAVLKSSKVANKVMDGARGDKRKKNKTGKLSDLVLWQQVKLI